ncbi:MAG: class I SAM-dependent methyltransferase, partial [Chitinophagaceae bacterium]
MYTAFELGRKYVRYYWHALNSKGHGVHSPFAFDFIKFVKNDKKPYPDYQAIELIRKELLGDKSVIEVEDFGAGSTVIKTNKRAVDKMAASSLKPRRFAQLLFRLVQYYRPHTMVELGTSFGITSSYLASGNPEGSLYTLEGSPSIADIAQKNFQRLGLANIHLIEGDFNKTLAPLLASLPVVDLAFVDGNHKKEPTLHYFNELMKKSSPQTILVFDDIHWSKEMEEAWAIIQQDERVTLTID